MTVKIKPLYNHVLVQRNDAETKTKGGIIIPDTSKEKPSKGKIIAVGDGSVSDTGKNIPLTVKAGQEILFAKWGGTEIKEDGQDYILIKESDILAIIE
jgi:chaperonin GroES